MEDGRMLWLESKHSKSYLLMKLQRAFCMRQFNSERVTASLGDAIEVLLDMDCDTGYPQMLGFKLANDLLERGKAIGQVNRLIAIYEKA